MVLFLETDQLQSLIVLQGTGAWTEFAAGSMVKWEIPLNFKTILLADLKPTMCS